RRRLQLLRLLMDEPNVLFLDEPTNDLDIETLTQLEDLLDGWPGSMVVISHDRFFIERTTDRTLALLGDRTLRMLPRGIDEYLERRRKMIESAAPAPAAAPAPSRPGVSAADARAAKKELQKVERQLDKLSDKEGKLHGRIADNATDFELVAKLDAELRELAGERDELEMRWLELAEDA
ncbi:ABC transporter ATP-binding protein, partial [Streptomyces sp. SID6041]|nr:ABC transporter ATP-binding protein [Streptomyces sp. SID6041]